MVIYRGYSLGRMMRLFRFFFFCFLFTWTEGNVVMGWNQLFQFFFYFVKWSLFGSGSSFSDCYSLFSRSSNSVARDG
ncbi:hypothetical protein QBC36DRAFT_22437 [Triangularia setosa]|uniref:Uncharacterized protein n=1 Tax=Triangularia setosa TaxID=2587417 RepID=A0AAN7A663_9PEZI|nr:hypothetical protein QBC36DRAFT_22437 [Podospora setosa]